jgi:hypothetical protein
VILEDRDYLPKIKSVENSPEKAFNVGLELCLTWVNRILFLKLLESQLLAYHNKDEKYRFLHKDFVNDYDELNDLFFSALAKEPSERHPKYKEKYKDIPYLNSSLFETSELENEAFPISALNDDEVTIYSNTVLKDAKGKRITGKLSTLEYLFKFLDAYDFATDGTEGIEDAAEAKTLINASVLGLIFEKINGYKEGSFYTPAYITMYMCRETLRPAMVQKFKEQENDQIESFEDLISYCRRYFKIEDLKRLNEVFNQLRICDPAVGSGHFLVSALNELIVIKNELGILVDAKGLPLQCDIEIVNDELYILDNNGLLFEYKPESKESTRIQHTIFHEKQTLIENCLFGVDINPNSVKICRLRLWIELLKNAYYTKAGQLQTLPNIDINIKCGNSVISRFKLDDDLSDAFKDKKISYTFADYKNAVAEYKETNNKERKREVLNIIDEVKNNFKSTLDNKFIAKYQKAQGKLINEQERLKNLKAFGEKITKADKDNLKKLQKKAEATYLEKEEITNNAIYRNAFEWRFEFPEVLADNGSYIGFDAVIGNPPYMLLQNLKKPEETHLKNSFKTATYKGDTFGVFIELANHLIDEHGIVNVIVPYTWVSIQQHFELRKLILNSLDYIIDLPQKVFEHADLDTTIVQMTKREIYDDQFLIGKAEFDKIITYKYGSKKFCTKNEFWQINLNINDADISILDKIENISIPLEKEFEVSQGYIPYRRSDLVKAFGEIEGNRIVDERLWHATEKLTPEFKQEIQGKDLSRFKYKESFQYVKYGRHLAGYVDTKFFTSPRVLLMEVTRGNRYKLTSSFVIQEFYNTPSIINIIHPDNDKSKLLLLTGLLNSSLFTWYHLKLHSKAQAKTSIPKILVREVRNLPFPKPENNLKHEISQLSQKAILADSETIMTISLEIDKLVYQLYDLTENEITIIENSFK